MNKSFVWGAWFAIGTATIIILANVAGASSQLTLLNDPMRGAGAGFIWGMAVCSMRDWLIERRHKAR